MAEGIEPKPIDLNELIRIYYSGTYDLNTMFEGGDIRGIRLINYSENSSYKPDSSSGMILQYNWSNHTGMQIAFSGLGGLYIRWNYGAIGTWVKIKYE